MLTPGGVYKHGEKPGKARIKHVSHTLRELRKLIESEKLGSVALPKLATGVGGLSWDEVKPLVESKRGGLPIPVYVYTTYVKGQQAVEN